MIHMVLRMRYIKSIILFIGVILGYISPKAFPKDLLLFMVIINDPSSSFILPVK